MARIHFWELGDDTLSPKCLKQFADYLRSDLIADIDRGGWDRKVALDGLNWIANLLDAESEAPSILRPVHKAKNRPKGSGKDWYAIGRDVEERIEEHLPDLHSASQLEQSRAKGAAIREVAESHRLTPRAVRTMFNTYQSAAEE